MSLVLVVFIALSLVACGSDDDDHVDEMEMDIVDTAVANGNFNTLVAAIQAAGLEQTLRGSGPFTVFAPTDDAFDALPPGTVDFLLQIQNKDILTDILLYHVYNGSLMASYVISKDGMAIAMINGGLVNIDVPGSVILNQGGNREAVVAVTDVTTSNGVIHVIDTVLDPGDSL